MGGWVGLGWGGGCRERGPDCVAHFDNVGRERG